MKLKNLTRRLITINSDNRKVYDATGKIVRRVVRGKSYKLLPAGAAVELPKKFRKHSYVVALLKCGDVSVESESEQEAPQVPVESESEQEAPKVPKVPKIPTRTS